MVPGLGRSAGEGIGYPLPLLGFLCASAGKESVCNMGDLGSIPAVGRSSGEGNGYLLQYSGVENSMEGIVHGHKESDTTEPLSLNIQPSFIERLIFKY